MSNQQFKSWDEYAAEAEVEPFNLVISPEETLVIESPTATALVEIMRGLRMGDVEAIMIHLSGESWQRLEKLFGGVGHKAMPALCEDLMDHFDLYEDVTLVGPGGGKVTRRRPTQIQMMLNQGYRPVGEARASSS